MKTHALITYLKYRWSAKKLHGVHSPFVYNFSEDILYSTAYTQPAAATLNGINAKYSHVLSRIKNKYGYDAPCIINSNTEAILPLSNMVVVGDDNPGCWLQVFNKYLPYVAAHSVIIIPGIHKTKRHTAKWRRIHAHPKVMMSIDVYGLGIIFFKKEFKEKQHFILKY